MRQLRVVNLDEIAARWQIPVAVLQSFITDYGLNPARPGKWVSEHWDLLIQEKQKAFDDALFPERFRFPTATSAKTA